MPVLLRYIAGAFLARLLLVMTALTLGVQLFDVLANAEDIVTGQRVVAPLLSYAVLRLPQLASLLLPLAALLAALLTLVRFIRHRELMVMRGAGLSIYRIVAPMLLVVLVVAPLHFILDDRVVAHSAKTLRLWQEQDYRGRPPRSAVDEGPAWIAVAGSIVHVEAASFDGHVLRDVTVIDRSSDGGMQAYTTAQRAEYRGGRWTLYDAERLEIGHGKAREYERLSWPAPIRPGRFAASSTQPAELTYAELRRLLKSPDKGNRPDYFYATWLNRKFSLPLSSLAMVLLAAPLGLMVGRRPNLLAGMAAGVAAGFLFFVFDNVALTLGESGMLPAALAAWVPLLLFSILAISFLLHAEG